MTDHEHAAPKPVREERRPPREGVEEVAPGILRLQLPIALPGLGHVNCYAMEDSRGITLVDPGLPGPKTWRELQRIMKAGGLAIERVHSVVITHSHPDHFGQAGQFRKRFGAEVITHRAFRTFLDPDAKDQESADDLDVIDGPVKAQIESLQGHDLRRGPFAKQTPWGGDPSLLGLRRVIHSCCQRGDRIVLEGSENCSAGRGDGTRVVRDDQPGVCLGGGDCSDAAVQEHGVAIA